MSESASSRLGRNLRQFIKFGMVGGSGVIVNLIATVVAKKIGVEFGVTEHDPFLNLFGSQFHIRWYHVFATIAFLVANTWNYQLNRMWTFKSDYLVSWIRGFLPFLITGAGAFLVSLAVLTALMNPEFPISLPRDIFDDSTGFRTAFYWAQMISIVVAMPVNFVINKLWAFRKKPPTTVVAEAAPA